jgi:hypothetical protein
MKRLLHVDGVKSQRGRCLVKWLNMLDDFYYAANSYSFGPKLFKYFDWNTNIRESMRNLLKFPTKV